LQNRRLTKALARDNTSYGVTTTAFIQPYLYLCIRIYAIFYTSHISNKIFYRREASRRRRHA
jgi:hypothetical protein